MTCGLYPQEGHNRHFCKNCKDLDASCEATCRLGHSCNFRPISPEEDAVRAYRRLVMA